MNKDILKMLKIIDSKQETSTLKTLFFDYPLDSLPGQFVMLNIAGIGEKPFSISHQDKNSFGVTISAIGDFSKRLHSLKVGESLGVKGPFGSPYTLNGKNIALIAGGYGVAPLRFLAKSIIDDVDNLFFLYGVRTADDIAFKSDLPGEVIFSSNDGTIGNKGFITDSLKMIINKQKIDSIYSCGPEKMLKKVFEISESNKIPCQISLERYMKCGFGVCGQCVVDPTGWRACKEGPVFESDRLRMIKEFGEYKRTASGRRERFE